MDLMSDCSPVGVMGDTGCSNLGRWDWLASVSSILVSASVLLESGIVVADALGLAKIPLNIIDRVLENRVSYYRYHMTI